MDGLYGIQGLLYSDLHRVCSLRDSERIGSPQHFPLRSIGALPRAPDTQQEIIQILRTYRFECEEPK